MNFLKFTTFGSFSASRQNFMAMLHCSFSADIQLTVNIYGGFTAGAQIFGSAIKGGGGFGV